MLQSSATVRPWASKVRHRVFSLETEYAICFVESESRSPVDPSLVVDALRRSLVKRYGTDESAFLVNGSKFHYDLGHAEWSLPECRTAREAAIYDKAADAALRGVLRGAEKQLSSRGGGGRLRVVKNNVDANGTTWGCHENYLCQRETDWLQRGDHLRLLIRYLVPFLVTRQVYAGAGRVGWGQNLEERFAFQIMQRADFIEKVVSDDTQHDRAIVNLGRERDTLAADEFRRLHLILADANMSGWATWLKLGTTGLLLRMLEDLHFGEIPHLGDPVDALHRISRDPTCSVEVPLTDGSTATAVQIQRRYHQQARSYLERFPASSEEGEIFRAWGEALDQLEQDPRGLVGKVDWLTKKALLDGWLGQRGLNWSDIDRGSPVYYDLLKMDIDYHNLASTEGLFYEFLKLVSDHGGGAEEEPLDSFFDPQVVRQAIQTPPPYTRAKIRGDLLRSARRHGTPVAVDHWEQVALGDYGILLEDPLRFFDAEVFSILRDGKRTPRDATDHDEDA